MQHCRPCLQRSLAQAPGLRPHWAAPQLLPRPRLHIRRLSVHATHSSSPRQAQPASLHERMKWQTAAAGAWLHAAHCCSRRKPTFQLWSTRLPLPGWRQWLRPGHRLRPPPLAPAASASAAPRPCPPARLGAGDACTSRSSASLRHALMLRGCRPAFTDRGGSWRTRSCCTLGGRGRPDGRALAAIPAHVRDAHPIGARRCDTGPPKDSTTLCEGRPGNLPAAPGGHTVEALDMTPFAAAFR